MNITEFNEMYFEMVNLLEWVNNHYQANQNSVNLEFKRIEDTGLGANPLTPEQVVNEYMKQVWIRKTSEK